ncbi:MAG: putative lipid II flippase FtsW [Clostridia bacterium]
MEETRSRKPFDFWLLMTVLALLTLGIIMVFSASAPYASLNFGDSYFFLKGQLKAAGLGLVGMIIAMNFNYKKIAKFTPFLLFMSIVLLIVVLVPSIGTETNGARRWLYGFQPSEIAKIAIILFFANSLSKRQDKLDGFLSGFLPYLLLVGISAGLLYLEPHLSVTIIIVVVALVLLYCGGAKLAHFMIILFPSVFILLVAVLSSSWRLSRVISFLDPWKDSQGSGYQIINSLYAIGSGGIFGRGLGKSLQKYMYIPEPHTDFIFSIIAEELGLVGIVLIMALFMIFVWRGIKIAMNAPDTFGMLTAVGITSLVAVQVIFNVGVVTSSMPLTGTPLPFFSYGGTSLLFLMTSVGILLNISRYSKYDRL